MGTEQYWTRAYLAFRWTRRHLELSQSCKWHTSVLILPRGALKLLVSFRHFNAEWFGHTDCLNSRCKAMLQLTASMKVANVSNENLTVSRTDAIQNMSDMYHLRIGRYVCNFDKICEHLLIGEGIVARIACCGWFPQPDIAAGGSIEAVCNKRQNSSVRADCANAANKSVLSSVSKQPVHNASAAIDSHGSSFVREARAHKRIVGLFGALRARHILISLPRYTGCDIESTIWMQCIEWVPT